jgi:hypothetical protein
VTHAQRFWRDLRQFRIAPISIEMVHNNLAESFGLPRSYQRSRRPRAPHHRDGAGGGFTSRYRREIVRTFPDA